MIVIFDIDGVLMDKEKKPIKKYVDILKKFYDHDDIDIHLRTGKREKEKENVQEWIYEHTGVDFYRLLMRPNNSNGESGPDLKKRWLQETEETERSEILLAFDDDPRMEAVYDEFNIPNIHIQSEFYGEK